ncbi:hypothetical protein UFOVP125_29 [uncultured Caudovirales phage]|uniref:Uncharacterized protein n=1 Tax=uncultured Caudovirales phage TaxID=2100421 RepID=A0A6J5LJL7_9CAUD|nr:hypothetical protein UFOVP125_29 [uncultured Caudovirales phage]
MNILELAKQVGFQDADWNYNKGLEKALKQFANLVAAHEREECAKLMFRLDLCGEEVKAAEAIRARGQA